MTSNFAIIYERCAVIHCRGERHASHTQRHFIKKLYLQMIYYSAFTRLHNSSQIEDKSFKFQ